MGDEWDLHAVVRSCMSSTSISAASAAVENTPTANDLYEDEFYRLETVGNESELVSYQNCGETLSMSAATTTTTTTTGTSISFDGGGYVHEQPTMFGDSISFSIKSVDSQPLRKRKSKQKKTVVEFREEELGNDGWAWRKYGQKPIKGSPHPRNYYRCSTTKDCLARKQVERSPTDSSTFIVSYSGDHLHPRPTHLSSLAGSTRSTKSSTVATALQPPCSSSSPPSASSFSPTTSVKEDEIELNDEDIDEFINNY